MKNAGKKFIASVGPGYVDEKIRPWNKHNTKSREGGQYYKRMWEAAINANADLVSITSYNEWGEGTQIESAASRPNYLSYGPRSEDQHMYVNATAKWALTLLQDAGKAGRDEI